MKTAVIALGLCAALTPGARATTPPPRPLVAPAALATRGPSDSTPPAALATRGPGTGAAPAKPRRPGAPPAAPTPDPDAAPTPPESAFPAIAGPDPDAVPPPSADAAPTAPESAAPATAGPGADTPPSPPAPGTNAPPSPPAPPALPFWQADALFAWLPDQTRDYTCAPRVDCSSPARSFIAAGARGTYAVPGRWLAALTLTLGAAVDQEGRPTEGYHALGLRGDVQVELGRAPDRFGLALRVSPVLLVAWDDDRADLRTDFPGFGVLFGRSDLWVEVEIPVMPTHADPRFFSLGVGYEQPLYTLEAGFATFSSLTWGQGELGRAGAGPGVWLAGRGRLSAKSPWEARLQLFLSGSTSLTLGLGYRWAAAP